MKPRSYQKIIGGFALSGLSALLLWLSFAYQTLGILIFIAFVPMLVAQQVIFPERYSPLAPALSISIWLGAIIIPVFQDKSLGMVLLPLAFFILSFVINKNTQKNNEKENYRWFILSGIAGWVSIEFLRSFIPYLGTWAFVGYALWDYPQLIQPVSIVGIYGLDLVIMYVNYGLALLLIREAKGWRRKEFHQKLANNKLAVFIILVLAGWIGSSLVIYHGVGDGEKTVRVGAVQPGLSQAAHTDKIHTHEERIEILSNLTLQAAQEGAELIVWPEMGLGFDPQQEYTQELQTLAEQSRAYLVLGYVVDDQIGFRNQAALISPKGEFLAVYSKTHPMLAAGEPWSLTAGSSPVVDAPIGRIGVMICFDNSFTDVARALGRQKVQIIANPSLLGSSLADLMPSMGVFRSLENQSAVIMADTAYRSAIFDPKGRVLAQTADSMVEPGILVDDVPIGRGGSIYSVIGDLMGWVCLLSMVSFGIKGLFGRISQSLEMSGQLTKKPARVG